MELQQITMDLNEIIGKHRDSFKDLFNANNSKVLEAKLGVEEGKYMPSYHAKQRDIAQEDTRQMYKGYREELLKDLTSYRDTVHKALHQEPKEIDYQKAMYNLQYLKAIEPKEGDSISQDIYYKEVRRIALEEPYLASNVLASTNGLTINQVSNIKQGVDMLLGNDIVEFIDNAITEVHATIMPLREDDGDYVVKTGLSIGTDNPTSTTFTVLSHN